MCRYQCEAFALRIFNNADRVDRAGRADSNTPKAYLAASYFIEVHCVTSPHDAVPAWVSGQDVSGAVGAWHVQILNQFGPLDSDLLSKQKYAAWRAAEISKALREGRPPVPPPTPDEQQQQQQQQLGAGWGGSGGAPADLGLGSMAGIQGLPGASAAGLPPPPPPQHHMDGPGSEAMKASVLPGQRFRPGSSVLYCEHPEQGMSAQVVKSIVAQVLPPDAGLVPPECRWVGHGWLRDIFTYADLHVERVTVPQPHQADAAGDTASASAAAVPWDRNRSGVPPPHTLLYCGWMACRYRLAMRDVFVEAHDSQLAPGGQEGSSVLYRPHAGAPWAPAEVALVNDGMGW